MKHRILFITSIALLVFSFAFPAITRTRAEGAQQLDQTQDPINLIDAITAGQPLVIVLSVGAAIAFYRRESSTQTRFNDYLITRLQKLEQDGARILPAALPSTPQDYQA